MRKWSQIEIKTKKFEVPFINMARAKLLTHVLTHTSFHKHNISKPEEFQTLFKEPPEVIIHVRYA